MGITASIDITPAQRKILVSLLIRYLPDTTVWAFGSRVKWTSRPDSDLDLVAFCTPEQQGRTSILKEAFEESSLPFRIDVLVWDEIPDNFRPNILNDHVVLLKADQGKIETRVGGSKWRSSTWGDEISLEYGKALRGYENSQGEYRVFGSNGPIGWTDKPLANGPGVILGRNGAYRGVQYSESDFFVIDTAYYVVPKTDLDMRWLYYAIQFHKLGEIDDGSPIPSTTRDAVYVRDLEVPPKTIQREIARILGSIDDKIEINRQINQTLEQTAQAIFKSWFVDFEPVKAKIEAKAAGRDPERAAMCAIIGKTDAELDHLPARQRQQLAATAELFPDELEESDLGLIPKGWESRKVESLLSRLSSKVKYTKEQVKPYGKTPVYEQGAKILLGYHDDGAQFIATPEDPAFIFGDHTCVTHLACEPFDISQNVVPLKGCDRPTIWVYYAVKDKQVFQEYRRHWMELISKDVIVPTASVCKAFADKATVFHLTLEANVRQSRELMALRDTLLPKLLSGELQIINAS